VGELLNVRVYFIRTNGYLTRERINWIQGAVKEKEKGTNEITRL
jgi:hypothetical protein